MSGDSLQMFLVMGLMALVLVGLIREWAAPDVLAMTAFGLLVLGRLTGVFDINNPYDVLSNTAPVTIAAMFILSAALEKTGVIDSMGHLMDRLMGANLRLALAGLMLLAALCSAFINNTPVVAVFIPVTLAMCRRNNLSASKVLLPLSYGAVLGGCCTLIGSSTNIIVGDLAAAYPGGNIEPLGMFEFTPVGIILLGIGILYVTLFGPWLLPDRQSITSVLGNDERKHYICHLLIKPGSPLVGNMLVDTELSDQSQGFRIIEVRRGGSRLKQALNRIQVTSYDRVMVAIASRHMETTKEQGTANLKAEVASSLGVENLSTIKGAIIEGIVAHHSRLIGQTLMSARFRQSYGMLVLAVHRQGSNVSSAFQNAELQFGDTVLLLGPESTFHQLREDGDFTLLEDMAPIRSSPIQARIVLLTLAAIVLISALTPVKIASAALGGCLLILWLKCVSPQEAYKAIDWTIIFMLYGMLALGEAMESSGAARWIAENIVNFAQNTVPPAYLAIVVLALFYLLGNALTEMLSNAATAVILVPIAINTAISLGLDPRPFVFVVAFSASLAFATPIGYQTHMMVYGAGGYRFTDLVKFGLPLNIILWITAAFLIPRYWPF